MLIPAQWTYKNRDTLYKYFNKTFDVLNWDTFFINSNCFPNLDYRYLSFQDFQRLTDKQLDDLNKVFYDFAKTTKRDKILLTDDEELIMCKKLMNGIADILECKGKWSIT